MSPNASTTAGPSGPVRPSGRPPVRKAVIPAAGLSTRFLPYSKAVPKEMLPIVDRPVIQYVVEEAVNAGAEDILIITSRHKKVMEDHFDRFPELEAALRDKGKIAEAEQVRRLRDLADIHFIRQGEALGLGHAIGRARSHIGDDPFFVLLGDDIMHERAGVLPGMLRAYDRTGESAVALMVTDDPSSYGCAAVEETDDASIVRITGLVEKPKAEDAPSNLAIMGRYLFTSTIFEEIERTPPGVGEEIQITDAMARLLDRESLHGFIFAEGRYDTGKKDDYLRCVVEMALERDDLGPAMRAIIADVARREDLVP
ncbi:MAG: UTP--glucose-1-phosphate uridylyltransferase [Actinomycetota bacterium]|nr:UTP--glucose-1-phosphate uridylyltransferase [Actinomycetota bacterium]